MVNLIVEFANCLRASDLRVSSAEIMDCLKNLEFIDPLNQEEFRAAVKSNFVKSKRDLPKFDSVYQLFFHNRSINSDTPFETQQVLDSLIQASDGEKAMLAIIKFISGDPLEYLEEINRIYTHADQGLKLLRFDLGPLAEKLEVLIKLNKARDLILRHMETNAGMDAQVLSHFNARLNSAFKLLMHEPRNDDSQKFIQAHEQHMKTLGDRPFGSLTQREVDEVREVIEILVRKLKDVIGRRYARRKRGVLDTKKTIRESMRYGGMPVKLKYKAHPLSKGRIVALCDVSSSVWAAARFMLNVLYSLQECFSKVRSFIFVAGLAEVTDIFENNEINDAITSVLKETNLQYHASTDYGKTLQEFKDNYLDILNKKTTVIIIGDGRTNYMNPRDWIIEEMRERSRRIIWLNPEPYNSWNMGDSEMSLYAPHCHEVRQCRSLNQLIEFVQELVL